MDKPKKARLAPSSTVTNSWGLVTGTTDAALAVASIQPDGSKYIQATALDQACILEVTGPVVDIPRTAAVIGVKVTVVARSMGVGDTSVRVQPLTGASIDNTLVSADMTFHPSSSQTVSVVFPAQEVVAGEFAKWDLASLDSNAQAVPPDPRVVLRVRVINKSGVNFAKVSSVRVDVLWAETGTSDEFFTADPASFGWTSMGGLPSGAVAEGVLQLADSSAVNGFQFRKNATLMVPYGVVGTWLDSSAVWPTPVGTAGFCYNAITANCGTSGKYFQVNLLRQGGVDYVGILQGPPGSNDPSVNASYLTKVAFPWGGHAGPFGVWLYWDSVNAYVYAGDDYDTPLFSVPLSSLQAGLAGNYVQFGTQVDAVGVTSQGTIRVLRFFQRGLNAGSGVVLDWQTRKDLANTVGFSTTTLVWHHSSATFDAYKVRFGGTVHGNGFFIPAIDGAINTEGNAVSVAANEPVVTTISAGSLALNDYDADGARELVIYVRNATTKVWSVYAVDALKVGFNFFKDAPDVAIQDFLVGGSTKVTLAADREFYILPVNGVLPGGATQGADVAFRAVSGNAARLVVAPTAGSVDVEGLEGVTSEDLGRALTLFGAASTGNNGEFPVTVFLDATKVRVVNGAAVAPDGNNGTIGWELGRGVFYSLANVPEAHQDAMPGVQTQVDLGLNLGVPLDRDGSATVSVLVVDSFGHQAVRLFSMPVRRSTPFESTRGDAGYRFAMPPEVMDRDKELSEKYLPVWDAVAYQWDQVSNLMKDLISPQTAPFGALRYMFQEMGLIYPSVPGYPEAALRKLLDNADAVHRSRFTVAGLRFYLSLLIPNSTVTITGFPRGMRVIFLATQELTWPTLGMIQSSGTDQDTCTYLFNVVDFFSHLTITVTTASPVSPELQEFVRATIRRELPMSDDPTNPRPITVIFNLTSEDPDIFRLRWPLGHYWG